MLYKFKENELYGFIDENGKVVIPAKYSFVEHFSDGMCAVHTVDDKFLYINTKGEEVIQKDEIRGGKAFFDDYAMVCFNPNHLWGFIDKQGNVVIEPQFDESYSSGLHEGLVDVCKNEKWGYIDMQGNTVVPFDFDWTDPFSADGFAVVKRKSKKFFIDRNGEKLKTVKCTVVDSIAGGFKEGFAVVKFGKEFGFINTQGEQVFNTLFESASGFHEGLSCVKKDGKRGYINTKGKLVIDYQFEVSGSFHLGVTTYKKGDKWGLINTEGKIIKEATYDFIHDFGLYGWGITTKDERKLAMAELNKKAVYINLHGEVIANQEVNPKSKFDHDLLKNWKSKEVWDLAEDHYETGGTTKKGATQHIYFVLKWLKGKDLLTAEGLAVFADKNNLEVGLWRDLVNAEGAGFLDRYYKLWYENEGIINFQIDPSLKFDRDENLDEYWEHYQVNK